MRFALQNGIVMLLAIAALSAACSSSDSTAIPTPTPPPDGCQVVWTTQLGSGHSNLYVLDAKLDEWSAGSHDFSGTARAALYLDYDDSTTPPTYASRFVATAGTYSVTGAAPVGPVSLVLDTAFSSATISGGAGTYSGVWGSSGQGAVTVTYQSTNLTLGTTSASSLCYPAP